MIIGSGLLARAFAPHAARLSNACVYAAGVSNSGCRDAREFEREHDRLQSAIRSHSAGHLFIYFGTCSVYDPAAASTEYVRHKIRMEDYVRETPRHLVFRLPQVAGRTPNPHTLLNYLFARVARSERFQIWGGATRNIIDVDDVASIAVDLVDSERACNETIDIANRRSYPVPVIVEEMERALQVRAIYDVVDRGVPVEIDTRRIAACVSRCDIAFDDAYLGRVIRKYYGRDA